MHRRRSAAATYITCTRVANICIAAAVSSAAIGRETQRINGWADGGAEVGGGGGEVSRGRQTDGEVD